REGRRVGGGNVEEGRTARRVDRGAQGHLRQDRGRQAQRGMKPMADRAGIGLRAPHVAEIERDRPAVGFLEIHAENHLAPSPAMQAIDRLRAHYAFSVHTVGLSLGAVDGPDEAAWGRLAALAKRLEPAWISDHLSWSSSGGRYFNDLLPLPYTEEALDVVVRNLGRVQEALGRPIAVENPACYLGFVHS